MLEVKRLRADHAAAVLAFEQENRAFFAAHVSDRGDRFFERFTDDFYALLATQAAGTCAFHAVFADDGSVLGRFNLFDIADGTANVGYRVARRASGRGLATQGVQELCQMARARYGLQTLRAAVSTANVASARVLTKAGFVTVGPAGPAHLGGKLGTWYERELLPPAPQVGRQAAGPRCHQTSTPAPGPCAEPVVGIWRPQVGHSRRLL
ncbi:MAG: GNAT family N-acetyltransferase [Nocardioides sp.]|nr:GNAT family N-acetyltransferase [Nocardioides sp.]